MFLTRRNFKAGRALKTFPLVEIDGHLGFKLGYCDCCNEPVLLNRHDSQEILAHLFRSEKQYKKLIYKLEDRFPVKRRLIKWLLSRLGESQPEVTVGN